MEFEDRSGRTPPFWGVESNPLLAEFFDAHPRLVKDLRRFDPAELVSIIGGLLTRPEWQASTIRLEVLQHLVVASAHGRRKPRAADLKSWLTELGEGFAGRLEDPSEDVFVARVILRERDCLIFGGTYESPAHYLQHFFELLEMMPAAEPYSGLKRAAHSLLTLSNAVATRAALTAYTVGEVTPLRNVSSQLLRGLTRLGRRVAFTAQDLKDLGIAPEDLQRFVFDLGDRSRLRDERLGYSSLERFPLIFIGDCFHLALPAAVSMAIRRAVIELCSSTGTEETLYRAYTQVVAESFAGEPLLGGTAAPRIPFRRIDDLFVANLYQYVDEGRLLHLCFVVDDFKNYSHTGTVHFDPEASRCIRVIESSLADARRDFGSNAEFKDGISVVVACLWGRPVAFTLNDIDDARWRVVMVSAPDILTLSWVPGFSPLDLWRVLDERDLLATLNIGLINLNGLLNLYAWLESLELHERHHLLPEDWNPDDGQPLHIQIPQNGLLRVRKERAEAWDPHHAITWDGRNVQVRREEARAFLSESFSPPLYVSMDDVRAGKMLAVFETARRGWWTAVETPNARDPRAHYRLWHACGVWIGKAAPVLERVLPTLSLGAIAWLCCFEDSDEEHIGAEIPDRAATKALIAVDVRANVVHVTAKQGFLASLKNPTNITETVLVEALVRGVLQMSGHEATERSVDAIVRRIVPNEWARDVHRFEAIEFRHAVQKVAIRQPVLVRGMDDAYCRIGLGWRVRARSEGDRIGGVDACCAYLNQVVDDLWAQVRGRLKAYRQEIFLMQLVENHDSIMVQADLWLKTARAILSLYGDTPETTMSSTARMAELSAGALASRILIEMALCECPQSEGGRAGRLDLARLMAKTMQIYVLGGWSEAIRYGAKRAEIKISPLGHIATQSDFDDQIANPYALVLGVRRFRYGAERHEESFEDHENVESVQSAFDPRFWQAWTEAFGFTIDDLRHFMDNVDAEGLRQQAFAFIVTFDELCRLDDVAKLPRETVSKILEALALRSREAWSVTPPGFAAKDWHPWRFRRRLSVISRPILQLSSSADSRYLVSPSMLRDGVRKVLNYCYSGGYDAKDFPPGRMRSWIGTVEHRRGHSFNIDVADRLRALGWEARANVALTAILNTKLDRDYGDIDVLAWRGKRLLAIECKDLELAMTVGEIARQLYEFRGRANRGRPDRLKKHLVRVEILKARVHRVRRFIRSEDAIEIEPWLVFSDLVPMHFSKSTAQQEVRLTTIDQIANIAGEEIPGPS